MKRGFEILAVPDGLTALATGAPRFDLTPGRELANLLTSARASEAIQGMMASGGEPG